MKFIYTLLYTVFTITAAVFLPKVSFGDSQMLAMAPPEVSGAQAPGAAGAITIISPLDHEVVDSPHDTWLDYYVEAKANAKQLQLSLDDGANMAIHDVSACPCRIRLPSLASGRHKLTLKAIPGGQETSVIFTVISGLR